MTLRFIEPSQRAMRIEDWPQLDRAAWSDAMSTTDLFGSGGLAAHWRPATRQTNIQHYGRWLGFLAWSGLLDPLCSPADRVTREWASLYHEHLARTVKPYTQLAMLVGLKVTMQAMYPDEDWRWLADGCNRLQTKARRLRVLPPFALTCEEIDQRARAHLERAFDDFRTTPDLEHAVIFRDALILTLMVRRPLRLGNFSNLRVGSSLRQLGTGWRISVPGSETKNGDPIEFDFPPCLQPMLEFYRSDVRVLFAQAQTSDLLWLTRKGPSSQRHWIHLRIVLLTPIVFGIRLTPHDFRDVGATYLALEASKALTLVASLLSHRGLGTAKRWYVRANSLRAGEYLNGLLEGEIPE